MLGSSPRRRVWLSLASLVIALRGAESMAQEEQRVPNWVPSLGLGFGIQSRQIDGDIDAILFEGTLGPSTTVPCETSPPKLPGIPDSPIGYCDWSTSQSRASDGASLDLSGQLLGPPLASLPLRPRPFVDGGFAFNYDSRTIAESGLSTRAFDEPTDVTFHEPTMNVRLRANPDYLWYAGGGVALQLPIEFTPVFLKLGAHYLEENVDAVGTVIRGFKISEVPPEVTVIESTTSKTLKIPGVGPSVGLEAEVWRFGPVALQFVADVFFTFPLSGTDAEFDTETPVGGGDPPKCTANGNTMPCSPPARFTFDADNVEYYGVASLRFAWMGY